MNLTLSFLVLHNKISHSPLITRNPLSSLSNDFIKNFKISKFSNSFYYSNSHLSFLSISKSSFKSLIGTAITLLDEQATFHKQIIYKEPSFINDSSFINCKNPDINGSAIYSRKDISLYNCEIVKCISSFGAILADSDIHLHFCTFSENKAQEQSSCLSLRARYSTTTTIQSSLLSDNKAVFFGAIFRESDGLISISDTNFTKNYAASCVGVFENGKGKYQMRFTTFDKNKADVHNGCLVVRQTRSTDISNCNFIRNLHKSSESIAAAAILVYINPDDSVLSSSFFINNIHDRSYTFRVYYGHPMLIMETCFTGDLKKEFFSDPDESILTDVYGGHSCKLPSDLDLDIDIGFKLGRLNITESKSNSVLKIEIKIISISCILTVFACISLFFLYKGIVYLLSPKKKKASLLL